MNKINVLRFRSMLIVVALYLLTGGVSSIFYTTKIGNEYYGNFNEKSYLPKVLTGLFVIFCLYVVFLMIGFWSEGSILLKIIPAMTIVTLIYAVSFIIVRDLADFINKEGNFRCSTWLAGALSLMGFLGIIYIQYCINREVVR